MTEKQEIQKKEAAASEPRVERRQSPRVYAPDVDVYETANEVVLTADMPGVDEQALEITLEDGVLDVRGHVAVERPEGLHLAMAEYARGDFHRTFSVSHEVDAEKIKASLKDGLLRIVLPKAEAAKPRRITVEAA
ncbi:MAG: Hsp20/alpha crystallin family protein [Kiritimatiellae bacterium]|nr:Hsp20/alpha crystallin family protein [Kiritimatiellia bacterium]